MNANRPYIDKTRPEVFKAMSQSAAASRKAARAASLDDGLIELVNTRVSQINGLPERRAGLRHRMDRDADQCVQSHLDRQQPSRRLSPDRSRLNELETT
ncbi:hypothetical protein BAUR920_02483 [Brevibacterium aurantiacum]|uniref:Uncharacterized protein n=1 Tax=Brevibacterium aurantiacum TaxID=273384 RepID=A0A2H1JU87_BREAU|nr:hypothetical protein BAUR920_02483 [Brevibacterium aurantiacum]